MQPENVRTSIPSRLPTVDIAFSRDLANRGRLEKLHDDEQLSVLEVHAQVLEIGHR